MRRGQLLIGMAAVAIATAAALALFPGRGGGPQPGADGVFHVYPGGDIQAALDAAAASSRHKHVLVHEGVYRPPQYGQAFVWLNAAHDGITLEAAGHVELTAANPEVAKKTEAGYPAMVNHVVYFGDGISRSTVFRGFKITGANGFMTTVEEPAMETSGEAIAHREMFFYSDGGGIKIYGRSYPTIENVEVFDNFSSPCGAGVSVEHRGFTQHSVLLKNCVFRNNRCTVTGSAVDLLNGSSAEIENCLFVGNLSDTHIDDRVNLVGRWKPEHGSGALTLFESSRVVVRRSTFTANRNGVDDSSTGNRFENCIFWHNTAPGGWPLGRRYELDLADGSGVRNCSIGGDIVDLNHNIDLQTNVLDCDDPQFDEAFVPQAKGFEDVGYRPVAPRSAADGK